MVWKTIGGVKKYYGQKFSGVVDVNLTDGPKPPFKNTNCITGITSVETKDDVYLFENEVVKLNDNKFKLSTVNHIIKVNQYRNHKLNVSELVIGDSDRIVCRMIYNYKGRAGSKDGWMGIAGDIYVGEKLISSIYVKCGIGKNWGTPNPRVEVTNSHPDKLIYSGYGNTLEWSGNDRISSGSLSFQFMVINDAFEPSTISFRNGRNLGGGIYYSDLILTHVSATTKSSEVRYGSDNIALFFEG